jgi:rhodanese-related sulfurtransferase
MRDVLKVKPRRRAELSPLETGSYIHYLLQHTLQAGDPAALTEQQLQQQTSDLTQKYVETALQGADTGSKRFDFLLRRMQKSALELLRFVVEEQRQSQFHPAAFELELGKHKGAEGLVFETPTAGSAPKTPAGSAAAKSVSPAAPAAIITGQEVKKRMEQNPKGVVLDVRTPAEFAEGHIPGAVNLPVDEVKAKVEALIADKQTAIVVYCRSGARSARAMKIMKELGFETVFNLAGGIRRWQAENHPLEK